MNKHRNQNGSNARECEIEAFWKLIRDDEESSIVNSDDSDP
jgi:hypothetical protein